MSNQVESEYPSVYVVDAQGAVHAAVQSVALPAGVAIERFAIAEGFLKHCAPNHSGCLIADVRAPKMGGLELLKLTMRRSVFLPTIVVGDNLEVATAVTAMQMGAIGVLEKPCPTAELEAMINRGLSIAQNVIVAHRKRRELESRLDTLTTQEQRILKLVISGHTNSAIARRIDRGIRTVERCRTIIFRKTQTRSVAELVRFACEAEAPLITPMQGSDSDELIQPCAVNFRRKLGDRDPAEFNDASVHREVCGKCGTP